MSACKALVCVVFLLLTFISCAFCQYNFTLVIACSSSTICTSIYNCPSVLSSIYSQLSPSQIDDLKRLQCTLGPGRYPFVCCPRETTSNTPQRSIPRPSNGLGNILPSTDSCGFQSFGEKILGGQFTEFDEFPWMALFEYSKPNSQTRSFGCGGALINQRYVLTAAHCLVGKIEQHLGQIVNIRLGEYDLRTTIDCVKDDCADPVKNVGFEEIIPHPGYRPSEGNVTNDIGLVRLSEDVPYTDFIKPICLPSTLGATRSAPATLLQVAGWGRTLNSRESDIKQKVTVPVFDHSLCRQKFAVMKAYIDDSHLCAGGNYIEDTCNGDSGGPLTDNHWVVEGIVSFGRSCGLEGWPGVYSRVSSFEDWIKSSMRP